MPSLVLDTHSMIWFLNQSPRLSSTARQAIRSAIEAGNPVYVSAISVAEVTYLVEKGRLINNQLDDLLNILHRNDSGFIVVPFDLSIAEVLPQIPRRIVPDMPDRIIAATALHLKLALVTFDSQIRNSEISIIW
jgi:PIN domain nuclease of toxin-antitoxin system